MLKPYLMQFVKQLFGLLHNLQQIRNKTLWNLSDKWQHIYFQCSRFIEDLCFILILQFFARLSLWQGRHEDEYTYATILYWCSQSVIITLRSSQCHLSAQFPHILRRDRSRVPQLRWLWLTVFFSEDAVSEAWKSFNNMKLSVRTCHMA